VVSNWIAKVKLQFPLLGITYPVVGWSNLSNIVTLFQYVRLVVYLPLWKYEFVSWDDDIPNIWKNKHVPNHQPAIIIIKDIQEIFRILWVQIKTTNQLNMFKMHKSLKNHKIYWQNPQNVASVQSPGLLAGEPLVKRTKNYGKSQLFRKINQHRSTINGPCSSMFYIFCSFFPG